MRSVGRQHAHSMSKTLIFAMGLFSLLFGSCSRQPAALPEQPVSKFRAGQVWAFKTPTNQPDAKLTVLRLERGGKLCAIEPIAPSRVSYPNGPPHIQPLPFAEAPTDLAPSTL